MQTTISYLKQHLFMLLLLTLPAGDALFAAPVTPDDPPEAQLVPLEVNRAELVEQATIGSIRAPGFGSSPQRIAPDGTAKTLPGTSSITYNFRVGDSAVHMAGDHVEPSVSITHQSSYEQRGLNTLSQIGNRVTVLSGRAEGATGTVIGKHGGIENVMVEFEDGVYDDLAIGDRMQVRAKGLGMEARNVDDVAIRNMSPRLLDALNENGMGINDAGELVVPVTHEIPAKIMGSGLGQDHVHTGDYDIQFFDEGVVERYNLDELRFGDIVAIIDADHQHGRIYREGAISIGVVVHGISRVAGHGPGVTSLLTSPSGNIDLVMDEQANLKNLLDLR